MTGAASDGPGRCRTELVAELVRRVEVDRDVGVAGVASRHGLHDPSTIGCEPSEQRIGDGAPISWARFCERGTEKGLWLTSAPCPDVLEW